MLTTKDPKIKMTDDYFESPYYTIGAIMGTLNGYKRKELSKKRALDDIDEFTQKFMEKQKEDRYGHFA